MLLTALEKQLLDRMQENFPIHPRPYAVIGQELGMTEQEVIDYVRRFKEQGYIRRIGPFYIGRAGCSTRTD
jgi:DNA-binding Lrp family transcriptional regulator